MSHVETIQLFDSRLIRTYWDDQEEKWYFCINDVVAVLTDSVDPAEYFKKLRKRDADLDDFVRGTVCPPHQFTSSDGKLHASKCADTQTLFRIIQSIPSKKAEPFKQWMAAVAAERIRQMQDPERGIQMSLEDYKRLGMSDSWINQRLKSIEIRNGLTDAWQENGITESAQFASLTDIIYQAWSGLTSREYRHLKGLHQENLRDNMSNEELVMNMLAELTTTNINKSEHPQSMHEHASAAARGGSVAKVAREAFEAQTGKKVVTSLNAHDFMANAQSKLDFQEAAPLIESTDENKRNTNK